MKVVSHIEGQGVIDRGCTVVTMKEGIDFSYYILSFYGPMSY